MVAKFIQVGIYMERLIFEMLIGSHIWVGVYLRGLYTGGVLTGFYSICINHLEEVGPLVHFLHIYLA